MKTSLIILFLGVYSICFGQTPTIGLLMSNDSVSEGYTLFTPEGTNKAYLIDNCGRRINEWTLNNPPGLTCYLLENGNLLFAGIDSLELRDWNNNQLWSYSTSGIRQHHDIEPLPNGNILCVSREIMSIPELIAAGRDTSLLASNFKIDRIVELQPIGTHDANIVWDWHFKDHLIQDFDSSKANFGVVENHPELVDLNFDQGNTSDWSHLNSVDYNAELDQILVSSKLMGEIYIIDHSTTTAEAAGHSGGNSSKGGDIIWRWGNPEVYRQGTPANQVLFDQHDAKWVENGYLHDGKISVFNNGGLGGNYTYSSVHLIEPQSSGFNYIMNNSVFEPTDFSFTWNGNALSPFVFSDKKCSAISLENGGFMIGETDAGRFIEINENKDVVWLYTNPVGSTGIYNQFDIIPAVANAMFRAEKYPVNYPAFTSGVTTGAIIEDQNSLSANCISSYTELDENLLDNISLINPVVGKTIQFSESLNDCVVKLIDLKGSLIQTWYATNQSTFHLEKTEVGIYFIQIETSNEVSSRRILLSE